MTDSNNRTLTIYNKLALLPFGRFLFSKIVCFTAPYFSSIRPRITHLAVNQCECLIKKRRRVTNHINTVHVIAICNGLEMAMGVMAEASVPRHLRWLPMGMNLDYTAKANSDIRCFATIPADAWQPGEQLVAVTAKDDEDKVVVKGTIKIWVTEKPTIKN